MNEILIFDFESHPSFGLNSKYQWPYLDSDACDLILSVFSLRSLNSRKIIDWVADILDRNDDFRRYRLTPEELSPDPTNLFDEVVYNQDNLVVKNWCPGILITSAIFHLIRSQLYRWKRSYDIVKEESSNFSDVEFVPLFFYGLYRGMTF
jgi:hypothetical protein